MTAMLLVWRRHRRRIGAPTEQEQEQEEQEVYCWPQYKLNSIKQICIYKTQKRLTIIQYKVINIQTIGVGGSY